MFVKQHKSTSIILTNKNLSLRSVIRQSYKITETSRLQHLLKTYRMLFLARLLSIPQNKKIADRHRNRRYSVRVYFGKIDEIETNQR